MNKRDRSVISTGISSILTVFVVLCLITFAVLALSSARADLQYSEQTALRTSHYYEAEGRANRRLKEIDAGLLEQYNSSKTENDYLNGLEVRFVQTEGINLNRTEDGVRISFSEKIDDTAELNVELSVWYPDEENDRLYRIEKWQSVSSEEWNPDMTLPVMQK